MTTSRPRLHRGATNGELPRQRGTASSDHDRKAFRDGPDRIPNALDVDVGEIVFAMIVIGLIWLALDRLLLAPLERATIERWGMVQRS